MGSQKKNFINC